jgi:SAM-dependent methyltransferase
MALPRAFDMPAEILPRPEIIRSLLQQYYVDGGAIEGASSHWRHYAKQFKVEADETGAIRSLAGVGFGNAHWSSWPDRLFSGATVFAHLLTAQERQRVWRAWLGMKTVCRMMGTDPTFDAFRQACSLSLIQRHLPGTDARRRVLIIGDGHGLLAGLVKHAWRNAEVTLVDLGRTLLFQTVNLQRAYPEAHHVLAGQDLLGGTTDFVYCAADQMAALESVTFDLAVNIASMQKMTPDTVDGYFRFLRRHMAPNHLFYCCNRDRKVLPGGEVSSFADYPWRRGDRHLVDEPCPWHQYFLSPAQGGNGPRVAGLKVPFIRLYDGPHRHRLSCLEVESA